MSEESVNQSLPTLETSRHPWVQEHPADTLHACRDVLNFVMDVEHDESGATDAGRDWILMAVVAALGHEEKRVIAKETAQLAVERRAA